MPRLPPVPEESVPMASDESMYRNQMALDTYNSSNYLVGNQNTPTNSLPNNQMALQGIYIICIYFHVTNMYRKIPFCLFFSCTLTVSRLLKILCFFIPAGRLSLIKNYIFQGQITIKYSTCHRQLKTNKCTATDGCSHSLKWWPRRTCLTPTLQPRMNTAPPKRTSKYPPTFIRANPQEYSTALRRKLWRSLTQPTPNITQVHNICILSLLRAKVHAKWYITYRRRCNNTYTVTDGLLWIGCVC